jgi:hypothetical protein
MDTAKIRLSPEEEALLNRTDWILTKNKLLGKVKQLLSELQLEQSRLLHAAPNIPGHVVRSSPKISKGENYKGLPWIILDYPRLFTKDSFLAIRTLFWWGNFFSTTLHVSGTYKNAYLQRIIGSFALLRKEQFCICINEDEWQHHFEDDNYKRIDEMNQPDFEAAARRQSFIKVAKKLSLDQWNDADMQLANAFIQLTHILED